MAPTRVVAAAESFATAAAREIAARIGEAVAARGKCTLALCGGSTPEPVYRHLAAMVIRWASVVIYFGDERAVPPAHPDSNFGMAQRALLDRVPIAAARIHRMEAERGDIAAAAVEYDRLLPPRLDVLLLGVGPDGHVASLFPGAPSLRESRRRVLAVAPPPLPLQPQLGRMTITPPVIAAARQVMVMVAGGDKAAVVARVLAGPTDPDRLPAQLARNGTWILDHDAASLLQRKDT